MNKTNRAYSAHETMQVAHHSVVSFHYTLRNQAGQVLDASDGKEAFAYIQGTGMIVPGLERQMSGRVAGDTFTAVVPPAEGYGEMDEKLLQRVPLERFGGQKVEAGMEFQTDDHRVWTVAEVDTEHVLMNGNHVLAGETLHFDVNIEQVRAATAEELAHGHVHGPGGHAH
jgi:FKBP-type peptidyl-prolyl cis-trans isomerase SlyD